MALVKSSFAGHKPDALAAKPLRHRLYVIAGLAGDPAIYHHAAMEHWDIVPLLLEMPAPEDTLPTYACRMARHIDTSGPFSLMGTSFGGILAVEMSKILSPRHLILIACAKTRAELPLRQRLLRYVQLYRIQGRIYDTFTTKYVLKTAKKAHTTALQNSQHHIKQTNPAFIRACVRMVAHWQNHELPKGSFVHIHGTDDRLFPIKRIQCSHPISGGAHLLLQTRSEEVRSVLRALWEGDLQSSQSGIVQPQQ